MLNKNILFREKIVEILLQLLKYGELTESEIAKKTDLSYSHVIKVLKKMIKEDIIAKEKSGRTQKITFSVKGSIIARRFKEIYGKLGYLENKEKEIVATGG